jgi:hypothetical protein
MISYNSLFIGWYILWGYILYKFPLYLNFCMVVEDDMSCPTIFFCNVLCFIDMQI